MEYALPVSSVVRRVTYALPPCNSRHTSRKPTGRAVCQGVRQPAGEECHKVSHQMLIARKALLANIDSICRDIALSDHIPISRLQRSSTFLGWCCCGAEKHEVSPDELEA